MNNQSICCICLNEITGEKGEIADCTHCFCLGCIEQWCKGHTTCPLDRSQISIITIYDGSNSRQNSVDIQSIYQPPESGDNSDAISLDIDYDIGQFYNFWRSRHFIHSSFYFNQIGLLFIIVAFPWLPLTIYFFRISRKTQTKPDDKAEAVVEESPLSEFIDWIFID